MRKVLPLIVSAVIVFALTGCLRTYTFQQKRADQNLAGNRGVILGQSPLTEEVALRPTQRTVIGVDIELPTMDEIKVRRELKRQTAATDKNLNGNKGYMSSKGYSDLSDVKTKETRADDENLTTKNISRDTNVAQAYDTYKVKNGDTLQKIAARADIYGKASKWRVIYEANKDKIKKPDRIYIGQVLRIPRQQGTDTGQAAPSASENIK